MCQETYTKISLNQDAYEKLREFGDVFGTPSQAVVRMYNLVKELSSANSTSAPQVEESIVPTEEATQLPEPTVPMRTVILGHPVPPMPKPKAMPDYDTDRAEYGESTNEETYPRFIMETLYEMGGRGKRRQIMDVLKSKMLNQLSSVDLEIAEKAKLPRWEIQANFARLRLSKDGLVKVFERGTPDWGMWELTDKGVAAVERQTRRQAVS